jgi:hypothetical protein
MQRKTYYKITKLSDPAAEQPPFLVKGILKHTITLMYGEAKIGKSTLAAALAAALADGKQEFLGKTITATGPVSVGVIAGDFGDGDAYAEQFRLVTDADSITIYHVNRPPNRQLWDELRLDVQEAHHNLVIVDNLTAFIPGSLNDDVSVNEFYDFMDGFARRDVAVLVIAHISEKTGEHGKSKYPMGSSAIRARARWLWRVERCRNGLRMTFEGNGDAPHEMIVSEANGVPSFDVLSTTGSDELADRRDRKARERQQKTRDQRSQYRDFVIGECPHLNGAETAAAISARFGGAVSSHQSMLSKGAYGVRRQPGGGWIDS